MDDASRQLNRVVAMKHSSFRRAVNRNMNLPAIAECQYFTRSELSNSFQLADLLAYSVYRAFRNEDIAYHYFGMLLLHFYRKRGGTFLDGLKVWPEVSPLLGAARTAWNSYRQNVFRDGRG